MRQRQSALNSLHGRQQTDSVVSHREPIFFHPTRHSGLAEVQRARESFGAKIADAPLARSLA